MYTTTFRQFEKQVYDNFKSEYQGSTKQDFKDTYQEQQLWDMWLEEIAKDKNPTDLVLKRLYVGFRNRAKNGSERFWSFIRFNGICLTKQWYGEK